MSRMDKQGVVRGRCRVCSTCRSYWSEDSSGLICSECGHPPTKHEKTGGDNSYASIVAASQGIRTMPPGQLETGSGMYEKYNNRFTLLVSFMFNFAHQKCKAMWTNF